LEIIFSQEASFAKPKKIENTQSLRISAAMLGKQFTKLFSKFNWDGHLFFFDQSIGLAVARWTLKQDIKFARRWYISYLLKESLKLLSTLSHLSLSYLLTSLFPLLLFSPYLLLLVCFCSLFSPLYHFQSSVLGLSKGCFSRKYFLVFAVIILENMAKRSIVC